MGRVGHLAPNTAAREFSAFGEVLAVRHLMMPVKGKTETVAIHAMKRPR